MFRSQSEVVLQLEEVRFLETLARDWGLECSFVVRLLTYIGKESLVNREISFSHDEPCFSGAGRWSPDWAFPWGLDDILAAQDTIMGQVPPSPR